MVAQDPAGHTVRPLTAKDAEGLWIWRAAAVRSATGTRGNSRKRDREAGVTLALGASKTSAGSEERTADGLRHGMVGRDSAMRGCEFCRRPGGGDVRRVVEHGVCGASIRVRARSKAHPLGLPRLWRSARSPSP
jgi:hypothetical protein